MISAEPTREFYVVDAPTDSHRLSLLGHDEPPTEQITYRVGNLMRGAKVLAQSASSNSEITAVLIGASIGAAASILTLLLTRGGNRASEFRAAHRQLLYQDMERLGELIHQALAISNIILRRYEQGLDVAAWRKRGNEVSDTLRSRRRFVRYSLWGVDDGIQTLALLPKWITNYATRLEEGRNLLSRAESLRQAIDRAIRRSLR